MVLSRQFLKLLAFCFAIGAQFILPPPTPAQDPPLNLTGASNCISADLDVHFQLVNGPGDYYTIIVNEQNISDHACIFNGPAYGLTVVHDPNPPSNRFETASDIDVSYPKGPEPKTPPTAEPGQFIRQTFRWRTSPQRGGKSCVQPAWMSGAFLLNVPSLLKKVCSDIEMSRFVPLTSEDLAQNQEQTANERQSSGFVLSSDKSTYNQGEYFSLRLALTQPGYLSSSEEQKCPALYLQVRSPDGFTRLDEVAPRAFKGCPNPAYGAQLGDWRSGFEICSGVNNRWGGVGENSLEVFQLIDSTDGQLYFLSSNILRIHIADPSVMTRKWGTHTRGIAADVSLDKDIYNIGEDVPLHIALENFDSQVPIFGASPIWNPCTVVRIQVQDLQGRLVPENERYHDRFICTGGGPLGPKLYAKGEFVSLEQKLRGQGWLPNHPGVFMVVVDWPTSTGPADYEAMRDPPSAITPYAVARATVTCRIVDGESSHPN
jgi:hypothetical protein